MKETIYLVTGASGHLGNIVVRMLLDAGERVRCLYVEQDCPIYLESLCCEKIQGDIRSADDLRRFFADLGNYEVIVLHLAGMISISTKSDARLQEVNVDGTKNVLKFCQEHAVKRLLYCSSVHAIPEKKYNAPIDEVSSFHPDWVEGGYAKTKAESSEAVMQAHREGLDTVIVHPSGIIGPYDYLLSGHLNQLIVRFMQQHLTILVQIEYAKVRNFKRRQKAKPL